MSFSLDTVFLPKGYTREEFVGRAGLSKSGKINAYYYDPKGKCIKTKIELEKSLGNIQDLSIIDFRTGKINQFVVKKQIKKQRTGNRVQQIQQPLRQQQILKRQKINHLKSQPTSKTNGELKQSDADRMPRQLFWEKRLSNFNNDDLLDNNLNLPKNIKLYGPDIDKSTAIRSIAAALQNNLGIVGQTDSKVLDKNPCVFINPDQPLVHALVITEDDIRKQEERVAKARKQLELAYKKEQLV